MATKPEIKKALEEIKSEDRNMRVRALRVLGTSPNEDSAVGVLAGLSDPKRRVRQAAVKVSCLYSFSPEIMSKLKQMSEDPSEKQKIRQAALMAIVNATDGTKGPQRIPPSLSTVHELLKCAGLRSGILLGLLQRDLTPAVKELLESFVKDGSKEEAIAATKALCGFKVVNLGSLPDEQSRTRVRTTCDLAAGSVFYWVPRSPSHSA